MADAIEDMLANAYGQAPADPQSKPGASGGWDDPSDRRGLGLDPGAYLRSLPGRAWKELQSRDMAERGRLPLKDQLRTIPPVGYGMDAWDAGKEGRYGAAAGNALMSALELAGPARSKVVSAGDATLQAWNAAVKARPAQLTERAAEELAKLRPAKFKAGTKADTRRINTSRQNAERGIPSPSTPGGVSAEEAARRLGIVERTWPGNTLAGAGVAAGASGIPGVVLDDAMAPFQDAAEDRRAEKEARAMPVTAGAEPEAKHYWGGVDKLRSERNKYAGASGGLGAAGVADMYGAIKSVPWAARMTSGPMLRLAAELAMIHPGLGLAGAGLALAPWAVPAGLTLGGYGISEGIEGFGTAAMKKHAEAKERARLVAKILENYRHDRPAMSQESTQDYAAGGGVQRESENVEDRRDLPEDAPLPPLPPRSSIPPYVYDPRSPLPGPRDDRDPRIRSGRDLGRVNRPLVKNPVFSIANDATFKDALGRGSIAEFLAERGDAQLAAQLGVTKPSWLSRALTASHAGYMGLTPDERDELDRRRLPGGVGKAPY